MAQSQTRTTFVLGAPGPTTANSSTSSTAPTTSLIPRPATTTATAQASHSSIVDPSVIQLNWSIGTLLNRTVDQLALNVLTVTPDALDAIPHELLVLLMESLSKQRLWTKEVVLYLLAFLTHIEEFSLAQCDFLQTDLFRTVCKQLKAPIQSFDCNRSYHLVDFDGLLVVNLSECRFLNFDRCRRLSSGELLPILKICPRLEKLHLSGTKIKEPTLMSLTHTSKALTELDISSCILADALGGLCEAGLPLRDLKVSGTNFSNDQICTIAMLKATLHTLHLQFVTHIRDSALQSIATCTHLTCLDLSRNSNLSDEGFAFLSPLKELRTLNLSRTDLTDASTPILVAFHKLTHLDLSYNVEVNDKMMLQVLPVLPLLRVLILSYCGVTDVTVIDGLALHNKHIQVLKLNGCARVGNGALDCLAELATQPPTPLIHPPQQPTDDFQPSDADLSAFMESAPTLAFPASLLCLDFGSNSTTDVCIDAIGRVLYALPFLQRVGIWGSNLNTANMRRHVADWIINPPATPAAPYPTAALESKSNEFTISSSPSPSTRSIWLLDESMKTQPGTFLLNRFSRLQQPELIEPPPSPYLYGLDAYVEAAAATRRSRRKTVQFNDLSLVQQIPPISTTAMSPADDDPLHDPVDDAIQRQAEVVGDEVEGPTLPNRFTTVNGR